MNKEGLCWVPRVLLIVFIIFISLFSLDVFGGEGTLLEKLAGLLIHLIPTYILIIVLFIAWKRPVIGGAILLIIAVLFTLWFDTYRSIINFSTISLPVILAGILFIIFNNDGSDKINRRL